jgi:hypothetical protein
VEFSKVLVTTSIEASERRTHKQELACFGIAFISGIWFADSGISKNHIRCHTLDPVQMIRGSHTQGPSPKEPFLRYEETAIALQPLT